MLTDPVPRKNRPEYLKSDQIKILDLPTDRSLQEVTVKLESAMKAGRMQEVRRYCEEFLTLASQFYKVPPCGIRVLPARPLRDRENWKTELFGDYTLDTMIIRVWMRTAVRKEITSFGTFFSTLTHEFCHHLDFQLFHFPDSWHTRGFYERAAALYHHARGTPRKPLYWVRMGQERWRIDWQKTARGK